MTTTNDMLHADNTTTTTFAEDEGTARTTFQIYLCGLILLVYGSIGLAIFSVSISAMVKQATTMIGFRFLVSNAIGDALLLVQFAIWPAVVILRQKNIFPQKWRYGLHVYLDFTWYVVVYHYTIIAWSRMLALWRPMAFRCQSMRTSVVICVGFGWMMPFVQSVVSHLMPDFSYTYFSSTAFGYVFVDYKAYVEGWTYIYYTTINTALTTILPIIFYAITIYFLIRMRLQTRNTTAPNAENRRMGVEVRLLVPCMINNVVSLIGQLVITNPMISPDWNAFFVLLVFTTKSSINSPLYVAFSSALRKEVLRIVTRGKFGGDTTTAAAGKVSDTGAKSTDAGGMMAMQPLPPLQMNRKRLSLAYEEQG